MVQILKGGMDHDSAESSEMLGQDLNPSKDLGAQLGGAWEQGIMISGSVWQGISKRNLDMEGGLKDSDPQCGRRPEMLFLM